MNSLRLQIGLLYTILAVINTVFFTGMIFENQMDLLNSNFLFESERLGQTLASTIARSENDSQTANLETTLRPQGISSYAVVTAKGEIKHRQGAIDVPADIAERISRITSSMEILQNNYTQTLDSKRFTVDYVFGLKDGDFLFLRTDLEIILRRMRALYYQMAIAIIWGIIFHLGFGVFLYRRIFLRLASLTVASKAMTDGNLTVRLGWARQKADELNQVGLSFDSMAQKIEATVAELKKANKQMVRELEVGQQVQTNFLPSQEICESLQVSVYYLPMRSVSGDIYNLYRFKNGMRGLFIADATGHGVSAALITSVIFFHLEGAFRRTGNPAAILKILNRGIRNSLKGEFFATAALAIIDERGHLFYINAGHNPPLIWRKATGAVDLLEPTGPMLGLDGDLFHNLNQVPLGPGDRILLYTDGLVESCDREGEQFSLERVIQIIQQCAASTTKECFEKIRTEFQSAAEDIRDDVTFMLTEIPA